MPSSRVQRTVWLCVIRKPLLLETSFLLAWCPLSLPRGGADEAYAAISAQQAKVTQLASEAERLSKLEALFELHPSVQGCLADMMCDALPALILCYACCVHFAFRSRLPACLNCVCLGMPRPQPVACLSVCVRCVTGVRCAP